MKFGRNPAAPADEGDEVEEQSGEPTDPSVLQGTESMYGFVVAFELIGVAVLNLTDTAGKGAPKHPQTLLEVIALIVSVSLIPLIVTKRRTAVAFGAIAAAFFVTLPTVPDSLRLYHVITLTIAGVYALIIATRRRREEKAALAGNPRMDLRAGGRRPPERRARNSRTTPPAGPAPNRRYTPPKPKRKTPGAPRS